MLDEKFLSELLSKEDVSVEDKIKQIIGEHNSDTRGLVQKKDELLGSEKKLKEQLRTYSENKSSMENQISELEEKIKSSGSDELKALYETKINDLSARHKVEMDELSQKYDILKTKHLEDLKSKTVENGVKNLAFVDGLKNGFIARVMAENNFEPKEMDGNITFLSKDNHTIEEAINSFALTPEGKAYLRNPSAGGGAKSGNTISLASVTRTQFDSMTPEQQGKFCRDGGVISD